MPVHARLFQSGYCSLELEPGLDKACSAQGGQALVPEPAGGALDDVASFAELGIKRGRALAAG